MKKHITVDDLKQLTEAQKQHLFELWQPSQMQACCLTKKEENYDNCETADEYEDGNIIYIAGDDLDVYKTEEYEQLGILPLLSIGDCIEIIREFRQYSIYTVDETTHLQIFDKDICANDGCDCRSEYGYGKDELIDTLFSALIDIL